MDEPTSALDPVATKRIEELIGELKDRVTIVIVTHNMQQAHRVSDRCAFMLMGEDKAGELIEYGADGHDLQRPDRSSDRGLRERSLRLGLVAHSPRHIGWRGRSKSTSRCSPRNAAKTC